MFHSIPPKTMLIICLVVIGLFLIHLVHMGYKIGAQGEGCGPAYMAENGIMPTGNKIAIAGTAIAYSLIYCLFIVLIFHF